MDFALDEQQHMIAETAAVFFAEHASSNRTRAAIEAGGFDADLWRDFCGEMGLGGLFVPEALGGAGLGHVELALVAEQAGRSIAAIPLFGHAVACHALIHAEPPIDDLLGQVIRGERIAVAAERQWDKMLVPHGGHADVIVLISDNSVHLLDPKKEGAHVAPVRSLDGTRPLAQLDGVAKGTQIGGRSAAVDARATGLIVLAAEALGGAQAALDRTVSFALERRQFGRPIGSFQAYKHRLADRAVEIEQARSAVWWAACALDEKSADAELALHAAKSASADAFLRMAGDMIQLHGGIGFTDEHDAHLYFKRARAIVNLLGDGAFHREQVARLTLDKAA